MSGDDRTTRARIIEEVCERIAGGESVAQCFADPGDGYCSEKTFWRWIGADKGLLALYEVAISVRGLYYGEKVSSFGFAKPERIATAFGTRIDPGWVQLQKIKSDDCKWIAARMAPKKYGDRTILAGDADNPIVFDDPKAAILGRLNAGAAVAGATGDSGEPE